MLGELNLFLGMKIYQKSINIYISQSKYICEILKNIQMEDLNPIITPMVIG